METLLQDVRYGFRMLLQKPVFTAIAVVSLALGIGANSTIFGVVDALLLRTVPVADPDTLVAVYTTDEKNPGFNASSHLNWRDLREQNRSFAAVAGYDWAPMSVGATGAGEGGEAGFAFGQLVSGNYFQTLGVGAALGRTLGAGDDVEGHGQAVAVLSDAFWRRRFGADTKAVGSTVVLNSHPFTVVGVAPRAFKGTNLGIQPDLWVPMAVNRLIRPDPELNWYGERRGLFVSTLARLKPGVTPEQAAADLAAISARLQQEFPVDNKGRSLRLVPIREAYMDPNPDGRGGILAVSGLLATVVGLVLLIACANVANLLLARASVRRKEIAVRLSIGAGRRRLIRQLLTESVLLALLGGLGGLLLAFWASRTLAALLPALPFPVTLALDLGIDARVFAFTLALSVLTGLLFGLAPALQSTRPALVASLKGEAPEGRHGRLPRLAGRNLLVMGQVALSLVALVAAGLFLRSLGEAQKIDPGFEARRLATVGFNLDLQGYDRPRGENFVRELLERVRSVPGVAAASVAQAGPLQGSFARTVFREGKAADTDGTLVQVNAVGPGYFETMAVPIVRGRGLGEQDREGALPAVVINQTMAERFWPGEDPIGQRFHFFGEDFSVEVVGVARNAKYNGLGEDPQPYIYAALAQRYTGQVTLVVRTAGDPGTVLPTVQREVRNLDKQLPLAGVATIDQTLYQGLWAPRAGASLLGVFGLLALVLAAVGIYGVMSFAVAQRAREIGIRMALGARRNDVLALVLRQGMLVVAAGLAAGLLAALALSRFAASLLFGVSPTDPLAFGATSLLLAGVALAANLVPARRATAVDPVTVLKGA